MLYVLAILIASSVPRLHPPTSWTGSDKVAHVFEYAILGLLLRRAMLREGLFGWLLALAIAGLIGGMDERYQATVPGRDPSLLDWIADFCGASIGASLWPIARRRLGRNSNKEK